MRISALIAKLLTLVAAFYAVGVSFYLFLSPIAIHTITATTLPNETTSLETSDMTLSWYRAQGLWGVIVLVLFAGLYILGLYLAWRSMDGALLILSMAALILSLVSGLSIGMLYLPAAGALIIGAILLWYSQRMAANLT
ncbi:MAG: hypothetical protein R3293_19390 [Candidatus Promineifilaceae bacterium]|nr:hypothetical protein [Candidatus Promineifilaceae bacterium]